MTFDELFKQFPKNELLNKLVPIKDLIQIDESEPAHWDIDHIYTTYLALILPKTYEDTKQILEIFNVSIDDLTEELDNIITCNLGTDSNLDECFCEIDRYTLVPKIMKELERLTDLTDNKFTAVQIKIPFKTFFKDDYAKQTYIEKWYFRSVAQQVNEFKTTLDNFATQVQKDFSIKTHKINIRLEELTNDN